MAISVDIAAAQFLAFRQAPEVEQLILVETFTPKQCARLANLYARSHRAEDPINEKVWIKLLERASPEAYLEDRQDGRERDMVDAARLAAMTSPEAVADFLATCGDIVTADVDHQAEDDGIDDLDPTGKD